jgi:hypothetical protein
VQVAWLDLRIQAQSWLDLRIEVARRGCGGSHRSGATEKRTSARPIRAHVVKEGGATL